MNVKIALASGDGYTVNRHFGKCENFSIYEIDSETNQTRFIETRNIQPACGDGGHSSEGLQNTVNSISDCQCVVACRFGYGAIKLLEENQIGPLEFTGLIEEYFEQIHLPLTK